MKTPVVTQESLEAALEFASESKDNTLYATLKILFVSQVTGGWLEIENTPISREFTKGGYDLCWLSSFPVPWRLYKEGMYVDALVTKHGERYEDREAQVWADKAIAKYEAAQKLTPCGPGAKFRDTNGDELMVINAHNGDLMVVNLSQKSTWEYNVQRFFDNHADLQAALLASGARVMED